MTKSPNPIDVHVGGRVRMRRTMLGMSQEKLGEQLGLTFQQIQKYEKGANRIGASRLFKIAQLLQVPVQFFFDELDDEDYEFDIDSLDQREATLFLMNFVCTSEGLQLNTAFRQIKDPETRQRILELVKTLAANELGAAKPNA